MNQSGIEMGNGYNPESNTTVLTHIGQKTMILPSKPTLNDSRYDTRNHSVKSKNNMLHMCILNTMHNLRIPQHISILSQIYYA